MRCHLPLSINYCLSWVPGSFALEMRVPCASHVDPALRTYLAQAFRICAEGRLCQGLCLRYQSGVIATASARAFVMRSASLLNNFAESREIRNFARLLFENVVVFNVFRDFSQRGLREVFRAYSGISRDCGGITRAPLRFLPPGCQKLAQPSLKGIV